jgi:hypothetical protein
MDEWRREQAVPRLETDFHLEQQGQVTLYLCHIYLKIKCILISYKSIWLLYVRRANSYEKLLTFLSLPLVNNNKAMSRPLLVTSRPTLALNLPFQRTIHLDDEKEVESGWRELINPKKYVVLDSPTMAYIAPLNTSLGQ